jgi:hypothetical protein
MSTMITQSNGRAPARGKWFLRDGLVRNGDLRAGVDPGDWIAATDKTGTPERWYTETRVASETPAETVWDDATGVATVTVVPQTDAERQAGKGQALKDAETDYETIKSNPFGLPDNATKAQIKAAMLAQIETIKAQPNWQKGIDELTPLLVFIADAIDVHDQHISVVRADGSTVTALQDAIDHTA